MGASDVRFAGCFVRHAGPFPAPTMQQAEGV